MDPRERFGEYQNSLNAALSGWQADIWTAMPCVVDTVNFQAATLTAVPAIKAYIADKTGAQTLATMPTLLDVPIVFPRGGGYAATFPIKPGDECLVVFANRNIDAWWQNGGVQPPLTARFHDLSDGFAIPGPWCQATVMKNISPNTARFTSEDGLQYVELDKDQQFVNIVAAKKVTITAPQVEVNANQTVTVNTPDYTLNASTMATVLTPSYDVQASKVIGLNAPEIDLNSSATLNLNTPDYTLTATNLATVLTPSYDVKASQVIGLNAPEVDMNATSLASFRTGNFNMYANGTITQYAPNSNITGTVSILNQGGATNGLQVTGVVNATGDVIGGTISLQKHLTTGVTGGPGLSGPPVG